MDTFLAAAAIGALVYFLYRPKTPSQAEQPAPDADYDHKPQGAHAFDFSLDPNRLRTTRYA